MKSGTKRLTLDLTTQEWIALEKYAAVNSRYAHLQARWLIQEALIEEEFLTRYEVTALCLDEATA